MTNWDGLNRRKFPRVNYPCLIIIRHPHSEPEVILTHTENIGVGGVCVIVKKNFQLFSPVELEIDLMDTGNHLKCQGKVVWVIRRKLTETTKPLFYDLGIEFSGMPEAEHKRLGEIVHRLVAAENPHYPTSQ